MRYFIGSTIIQDGPPCDLITLGEKVRRKKRRKEAPLQKIGLGP